MKLHLKNAKQVNKYTLFTACVIAEQTRNEHANKLSGSDGTNEQKNISMKSLSANVAYIWCECDSVTENCSYYCMIVCAQLQAAQ